MNRTHVSHPQRLVPFQSDHSYDYLSVEEKECLMFLEETIGSLDAEADSGVSTDDTDYAEPPRPRPRRDAAARGELGITLLPGVHLLGRQGRSRAPVLFT